MKILLDARAIDILPYGVGRNAREMTTRLPSLNPEWEWIILRCGDQPTSRKKQVTTIYTPVGLFHYPREQIMLADVVCTHKPDLVHALWHPVPEQCSCPRILTVYDAILEKGWPEFQTAWNLKMRFWQHRNIAHADHVISISSYTQHDLLEYHAYNLQHVTVIPLGASASFQKVKPADIERIRTTYKLPENYIFCAAHDNKTYKNIVVVREALELLQKNLIDTPLIISTGSQQKRMCGWRALGYIPDEDLAPVIAGAMIAIDPSRDEGFGLPVLEAMTCGTPVICSNAASLPEVGGNAVRYFDPLSAQQLADAIVEISGNTTLQKKMKTAGRKQSRQFSWKQSAEKTLDVYKSVLKKKIRTISIPIDWRLVAVSESLPTEPFSKDHAEAYLAYAHTLLEVGQSLQAIEVFRCIEQHKQLDHEALFALATAYMNLTDWTTASTLLLKLHKKSQQSASPFDLHTAIEAKLNTCAANLREQGIKFKAEEQWKQAITLFKVMLNMATSIDATDHMRSAYFHLGECELQLQHYQAAVKHLQDCLNICPDHNTAPILLKEALLLNAKKTEGLM